MRSQLCLPVLWSLPLFFAGCVGPSEFAEAEPKKALLAEKNVKPGINKRFKDPKLSVAWAKRTFEGESREIFLQRHRIAKVLELKPGGAVADIGAGTGLFLPFFTLMLQKRAVFQAA